MAYLIDRINEQLRKTGYQSRTNLARSWLFSKIEELKSNRRSLFTDSGRLQDRTIIGKMYFFFYDPKMKESLPYYDKFPLVIPIEQYSDGFLGLNLHYIDPKQRIILLDKLSSYKNNRKYDETTRLKLSYDLLKAASKVFEKGPCLKRYLYQNVKSRFVQIESNEWDIAALLPFENFAKASKQKVFSESRNNF